MTVAEKVEKVRVLIVDDEAVIRKILGDIDSPAITIQTADSVADALEIARTQGFEIIATDKNLGDGSGLELIESLQKIIPDLESILFTGYASVDSAVEAMRLGISDYIQKPFDIEHLALKLTSLAEKVHLRKSRGELQKRLANAERLEVIGRLAGGIAHDYNNVLTAILSFAEFVRDGLEPDGQGYEDIGQVIRAAERASGMTRQLLQVSRQLPMEAVPVDVNEFVAEISATVRTILGTHTELVVVPGPDPWLVMIDPGVVERVAMNIVLNARDAMPNGGRFEIKVSCLPWDREADDADYKADYLCIALSDSGIGISPSDLPHVFEPFFSTKRMGEGTGLGLAASLGSIQQLGGEIRVRSEQGRGTTFEVLLPRYDGPLKAASAEGESGFDLNLRGTERVLVVDDEPQIRAIAQRMLEEYGYEVATAANGIEAKNYLDGPTGVDLVLSDVVMPLLSGVELAEQIRQQRPGIKLVLMTGYPPPELHGANCPEVVYKPFAKPRLVKAVRRALDRCEVPE